MTMPTSLLFLRKKAARLSERSCPHMTKRCLQSEHQNHGLGGSCSTAATLFHSRRKAREVPPGIERTAEPRSRPVPGMTVTFILALVSGTSASLADVTPFKTPSGNIECTIGEDVYGVDLRCVIFNWSGPPAAPQPAGCAGPWGHIFVLLDRGPVRMECGGPGQPNTAPGVDVAGYGQRGTWGGISCLSSERGLECSNADGRGFFLSRARQTIQ